MVGFGNFMYKFGPIFMGFFIIIFIGFFVFNILMIFSPKTRAKMLKKNVDTMKYFVNDSQKDMEDLAGTSINMMNNITQNNRDTLNDLNDFRTEQSAKYAKGVASAIKEGLQKDSIYCKHCGGSIDADSRFCKHCGKEQ